MQDALTAAEAAARLGVKRETLYAYVSRGLLQRTVARDGRTSLFDRDDIDALRTRGRRAVDGEITATVTTEIARIGDAGLVVRGLDLVDLVLGGASYEDVADLAWGATRAHTWPSADSVLAVHESTFASLASHVELIDRVRLAAVLASADDPLRHDLSPAAVRAAGRRLIASMIGGLEPLRDVTGNRLADQLWARLTAKRGSAAQRDALDTAMALMVDHGLAPSTFTARIAASVRCDPYSVVIGGLGVAGGTLHGAASAAVHELFEQAEAGADPAAAVGAARRRLGTTPGFGHPVYQAHDPRYVALMGRVAEAFGRERRLGVVHAVRDVIAERTDQIPNIDLALGALTYLGRMPAEAGEVVYAVSRSAGWLAHAIEEYGENPLRFRPRVRYVGRNG